MAIAKRDLPDHETMVDNVLEAYAEATASELAEGLAWYDEALRLAHNIAAGTAYTAEQIAAVIAVISPRLAWSKNTLYPALIAEYHAQGVREVTSWRDRTSGKGMSVQFKRRQMCLEILDGQPALDYLGTKTGNFYRNILGDTEAVTVDTWATKVALGDPTVEDSPGAAAYEPIADAYRDAADRAGINPRAMQAATWVCYRNRHGYGKAR